MRILVVAAHPDDEVLGCGASMARWAHQGDEVHVLVLGEGLSSREAERAAASRTEMACLHQATHDAAALLGCQEPVLLGLPDNRFDSLDLLDVVKQVESAVDRVRPQRVLTHHGGDLNIDHQVTHRAVLTATRPVPGQTVQEVLAFEVLSSTEWAFSPAFAAFRPSVFHDVTGFMDKKQAALRLYSGEMRAAPHARSHEAVEAIAHRRGAQAGLEAAEAFMCMRWTL